MNDLSAVRDFDVIRKNFESGNFSLQTITELIIKIREHRYKLSDKEASGLLEIPVNVLKNDVELVNENTWKNQNSGYFSGNMTAKYDAYVCEMREKIERKEFSFEDIVELTMYVKDNFKELKGDVDFILRNPEVTIRDDVRLYPYSNFKESVS